MRVNFGSDGTAEVSEIGVFDAFSVDAGGRSLEQIDSLLRGASAGRVTEGRAEVAIRFVLSQAGPRAVTSEWRDGFDEMVAFARSKQWISPDQSSIIAHIENAASA
ncbi:hypothetical protein ABS642_21245 [Microbacterium sp. A8/3-1]|uniref:Uncharacterized protein n=1 Tax=Microbacterium sp. A8/3-1 TaxID=3160749 RepID=A0AAU7VVA8_9MICO